jgi:signal transduction histidine kinase
LNAIAGRFVARALSRQILVGLAAFAAIAALAPTLLRLDPEVMPGALATAAALATLALVLAASSSWVHLRRHRFTLRALALGSGAVEADDLAALSRMPAALTLQFFVVTAATAALVNLPGVRPEGLDPGRTTSLFVLAATILGASAIPHYVLVRAATSRLFEIAPPEPTAALLEHDDVRARPRRRVAQKLLVAVSLPVALVGIGAVLVVHAHLRTLVEDTRRDTALAVARSALEPAPGALSGAGRSEAVRELGSLGFSARVEVGERSAAESGVVREPDGQITVNVGLEDGRASVRFAPDLDSTVLAEGAAIALVAVLLALAAGGALGTVLADDLHHATRRVRLLGTESVLRGRTEIAHRARFGAVAELARAIEVLAARFRVFAAAQERAIAAREAALRARGLFFASVSHDLKSPLNAVLGFTELLFDVPLTPAQLESLTLIATRGRELLALIETILDAARLEAGQLTLLERDTPAAELVDEAVAKARELAADAEVPVLVEVAEDAPTIPIDLPYAARALGVIVAHAARTVAARPEAASLGIRVTGRVTPSNVEIDVAYPPGVVGRGELDALFARRIATRARGLTLGLTLARSVIELHGGAVEIARTATGAQVVRCRFPLDVPHYRPRLTSVTTLG